MKSLRFLSKFAVICNACFVVFVLLNWLKLNQQESAITGTAENIPFFKEIVIILAFCAVVVNFLICLTYLILLISGKKEMIPAWPAYVNTIFLFIEIYYFFL